ncbi:MAG: hypothetical protein F6J87_00735 [Spirulina sp. SIO3F2]|nr:hypothetical protein [Spirulina sp. SIO3F2]
MSNWLEHSVQIEIPVAMEQVWSYWADLERMPQWMLWIDSVKELEDDPSLSRWTLSATGLEFSWLARMLKKIPGQIIQWESVDGLPNRGAVRFYDRHDHSIVRLTVAYAIPGIVGEIMDNLFLGKLVEDMLHQSLVRFSKYAQAQAGQSNSLQS